MPVDIILQRDGPVLGLAPKPSNQVQANNRKARFGHSNTVSGPHELHQLITNYITDGHRNTRVEDIAV